MASLDELLDAGDLDRRGARHRAHGHEEWLRQAECLVGGWAPTLRTAMLLALVLAAGLTGVLATVPPLRNLAAVVAFQLMVRLSGGLWLGAVTVP
ncbi:MAG TPA: hypothetical protein VGR06_34885 [Actinophytocola sp.]|uniref:hypothetical protein n=1 Tax=Actinophytocola sp. TaxID=1872138 RepID=UPI002DFD3538|nr:hypothetical protein [Actinophytocola sp.]